MKTRTVRIAIGVIIPVAIVAITLAFGRGPAEAQAQGQPAQSASGVAVLNAPVEEAVELATTVPRSWDYNPATRRIFSDREEIGYPIERTEARWRELLRDFEYYVLREKGTERAFTGELNGNKARGIYYSRATGQPLFSSEDKYDSGSGWPSFTKPISPNAIVYVEDDSLFTRRIEVVDSLSGSHLGHVFSDGPAPTGQRYCINSAALVFVPAGEDPPSILSE
jgi:peptide-methionine (R)-S-oxide reductase